jgi:hypothetical protein
MRNGHDKTIGSVLRLSLSQAERHQQGKTGIKESNKFGLLRKFLKYLARGAEESAAGGRCCPT